MATGGVSPPDSPPDSPPSSRSAPRSVSPPPEWTGPKRLDALDKFFAGQEVKNKKKGKVSEFKHKERPRGRKDFEARRQYREEMEQRKAYPLISFVRRIQAEGENIAAICDNILGEDTRPYAIRNYIADLKASLHQIQLAKLHKNEELPDFFNIVFHEIDKELEQLQYRRPRSVCDCFTEIRMQIYRILEYTHATLTQSPQPERSRSASPAHQQRSASPAPRRSTSSSRQPRPQSPQPRLQSPQPRPKSPQPRPQSPQPRPQSPQPRPRTPDLVLEDSRDQQLMQTPQNQQLLSLLHHYTTLSDSQREFVHQQLAALPQHIRGYLRSRFNMEHQYHQQQLQPSESVQQDHQRKEEESLRNQYEKSVRKEREYQEYLQRRRQRQDEIHELIRQNEKQQRRQQQQQQQQEQQRQQQQQRHQQQQQQRSEQLYHRQIDQYHLQRQEQRQRQPLMLSPQEEELREIIQNFNNLTIQEQAALQQTIQQLPPQEQEQLQYQIQLQQKQQPRR